MPSSISRRALLRAGLAVPVLAACQSILPASRPAIARSAIRVDAPFPMPPIAVPDFSDRPRFDIAAYGAAPDDQARTSGTPVVTENVVGFDNRAAERA